MSVNTSHTRALINAYLLSSIRTVSIVKLRCHCARVGSLVGSTCRINISNVQSSEYVAAYLSRAGVNAGDVDAGNELDNRRALGVVRSTVDVHTVYAVLMHALMAD
jgi:hypothetical protein